MNAAEIVLLITSSVSVIALLLQAKIICHDSSIVGWDADQIMMMVLNGLGMILPITLIISIFTVGISVK